MYNKKIPIDINCGFRIAIEVMGNDFRPKMMEILKEKESEG